MYIEDNESYIDQLFIESKYRKQGIGKSLILALEKNLSDSIKTINVVAEPNTVDNFFKSCGFKKTSLCKIKKQEK